MPTYQRKEMTMAKTITYEATWEDVYRSLLVLLDTKDIYLPDTAEEWRKNVADLIAWQVMNKEMCEEKPKVECPELSDFDLHVIEALEIANDLPLFPCIPPKKAASSDWYTKLATVWAIFIYAWHGADGIKVKVQIER